MILTPEANFKLVMALYDKDPRWDSDSMREIVLSALLSVIDYAEGLERRVAALEKAQLDGAE